MAFACGALVCRCRAGLRMSVRFGGKCNHRLADQLVIRMSVHQGLDPIHEIPAHFAQLGHGRPAATSMMHWRVSSQATAARPVAMTSLIRALNPKTLAVQITRKFVLWACVHTIFFTVIGYHFVSKHEEQKTIGYLTGYLTERIRAENQIFEVSTASIVELRKRFLSLYQSKDKWSAEFNDDFERRPDGSIRLRKVFFTGIVDKDGIPRRGLSGFIGRRHASLTDDLKIRMVIAAKLLAEVGPAWNGQFENLYMSFPENAFVMYWPRVAWGLNTPADSYFPDDPVVGLTMRSRNPSRQPVWTDLYLDPVAKKWNVTFQMPIDLGGRHVLNIGRDIILDNLLERLQADHPAGASNLILSERGHVIAVPAGTGTPASGIPKLRNDDVAEIYDGIRRDARSTSPRATVRVFEDRRLDAYVAYGEIAEPGWWFVTIYPRGLVLQAARKAADALLLLGILSFGILTFVIISILRERVARPIAQLKVASECVTGGNFTAVADGDICLPEQQDNEIGLLARHLRAWPGKLATIIVT